MKWWVGYEDFWSVVWVVAGPLWWVQLASHYDNGFTWWSLEHMVKHSKLGPFMCMEWGEGVHCTGVSHPFLQMCQKQQLLMPYNPCESLTSTSFWPSINAILSQVLSYNCCLIIRRSNTPNIWLSIDHSHMIGATVAWSLCDWFSRVPHINIRLMIKPLSLLILWTITVCSSVCVVLAQCHCYIIPVYCES